MPTASPCPPAPVPASTTPAGAPSLPAPAVRYGDERAAAAMLGLSPETLRSWRSRRIGPDCHVRFGRSVRYNLDALAAWAAAQSAPRAEAA